jgi:hypothetical protein
MMWPAESLVLTPELAERLRVLRLKAGLTRMELANHMGPVGKKTGNLEPGSVGVDEYILNPEWIGRGLDTALAQKLAALMLVRFRELANSLPPVPRSKR